MVPGWVYVVAVIWFIVSVGMLAFTFQKCGAKTLLLGNGAAPAAFMGMCD